MPTANLILAGKARAVIFPEDIARPETVDIPIYGAVAKRSMNARLVSAAEEPTS